MYGQSLPGPWPPPICFHPYSLVFQSVTQIKSPGWSLCLSIWFLSSATQSPAMRPVGLGPHECKGQCRNWTRRGGRARSHRALSSTTANLDWYGGWEATGRWRAAEQCDLIHFKIIWLLLWGRWTTVERNEEKGSRSETIAVVRVKNRTANSGGAQRGQIRDVLERTRCGTG